MTDLHANANPVTAPIDPSTEQGVNSLIAQRGQSVVQNQVVAADAALGNASLIAQRGQSVVQNQVVAADAALGDLSIRMTKNIADEGKKQSKIVENAVADLIKPVKIPSPPLPDMSSITKRISTIFNSINTPDTTKLNQAISLGSVTRSSAEMDKFKNKKSSQIAAKSSLKISTLISLLSTVNSLRNMLQKKKQG